MNMREKWALECVSFTSAPEFFDAMKKSSATNLEILFFKFK
jgi:hypothetical protein